MLEQRLIIEDIDKKSSSAADAAGASRVSRSRAMIVTRMVFIPPAAFLKTYFLKGGLTRGVEGLRDAVNAWVLSFATEAKVYEKLYADFSDAEEKIDRIS